MPLGCQILASRHRLDIPGTAPKLARHGPLQAVVTTGVYPQGASLASGMSIIKSGMRDAGLVKARGLYKHMRLRVWMSRERDEN